ncbi:TetR family transcriptional regulator [Permianibacter sp. IMCC34836]|uniref:TetR family transcriptional regulator n=1 Tax=Permianibacter fluminis TaxID=2738515 RepID=UPI0015557AF8|nr:TetR family transcriptional regulator [Permianibacter fluminis]NQD36926.1 TetR family transcriptional regulator [Permianibacter fluminis]
MTATFLRARAPEQKADRRAHLLLKAAELFQRDRVVPTAAQLAEACGLAKGTVYLYFRSKEEIFLALLHEQFALCLDDLAARLAAEPLTESAQVAVRISAAIKAREFLLPLAVMGPTILEQNASDEALLAYKQMLAEKLTCCAEVIAALPGFTVDQALLRLHQGYAMMIGCWQLANASPRMCALLQAHGLRALVPEFWSQLDDALMRLWR